MEPPAGPEEESADRVPAVKMEPMEPPANPVREGARVER
jgi:hypothetical protein